MRVVFVPHAYWPSVGGAERYTQGLAEQLAALDHEVHVVTADIDNPEAFYELGHSDTGRDGERHRGVTIHRLPYRTFRYRVMGALGEQAALASALSRLRAGLTETLSALSPEVVVTLPHLFPNVVEVVGLRKTSSWRLVYAPMLHEDDPYWSVERVADAVGSVDGVIALTDHERSRLVESYGAEPERTFVVPPGVDLAVGPGKPRNDTVLFLGRRSASKRLDFLYEAMTLLWERHPSVRLVVAGAPPVAGVDPVVWFRGDARVEVVDSPSEARKRELLATARVLVSTSFAESFGITTLEAWAHSLPVVVVETPVSRSVVRHGVDGLLTDGSRAESLADSLSELFQSPGRAEELGRAGRRRVSEEFSWPTVAGRFESLLQRLA